MSEGRIDYGSLEQRALLHVVRWALEQASGPAGPPGDHHFFITFLTAAPGVDIPEFLTERYPRDMTIVLKTHFRELSIDDDGFSVVLWFEGKEASLRVPFAAILQFLDPSASFVLRFDATPASVGPRLQVTASSEVTRPDAEVVSLADFRKKLDDD